MSLNTVLQRHQLNDTKKARKSQRIKLVKYTRNAGPIRQSIVGITNILDSQMNK